MKRTIPFKSRQRGFIALIATVVISAILIALMASVGMASFFARIDALGLENKREALALAESCANIALLALATSSDSMHYSPVDQEFAIAKNSPVNPETCVIRNVVH